MLCSSKSMNSVGILARMEYDENPIPDQFNYGSANIFSISTFCTASLMNIIVTTLMVCANNSIHLLGVPMDGGRRRRRWRGGYMCVQCTVKSKNECQPFEFDGRKEGCSMNCSLSTFSVTAIYLDSNPISLSSTNHHPIHRSNKIDKLQRKNPAICLPISLT